VQLAARVIVLHGGQARPLNVGTGHRHYPKELPTKLSQTLLWLENLDLITNPLSVGSNSAFCILNQFMARSKMLHERAISSGRVMCDSARQTAVDYIAKFGNILARGL
jgi:hypothetical protein